MVGANEPLAAAKVQGFLGSKAGLVVGVRFCRCAGSWPLATLLPHACPACRAGSSDSLRTIMARF